MSHISVYNISLCFVHPYKIHNLHSAVIEETDPALFVHLVIFKRARVSPSVLHSLLTRLRFCKLVMVFHI